MRESKDTKNQAKPIIPALQSTKKGGSEEGGGGKKKKEREKRPETLAETRSWRVGVLELC